MTQEETHYNKRCAEFLGWDYSEERDRWNEDMLHQYSFVESIDLKFHSDWNWIMDVLSKIEKSHHTIISQGIIGHYVNINREDVNILTQTLDNPSKFMGVGKTKKEAVVQAINQFLIWYEQNKTK